MQTVYLKDFMRETVGNAEQARYIKNQVVKQISRGRYELNDDNICKVKIICNDEVITVILDSSISIDDIRDGCALAMTAAWEISLVLLQDFIKKSALKTTDLFSVLRDYQEQNYKSGTAFADRLWFKLYSKTEIINEQREQYHATWIDYEKQLANGKEIYDDSDVCGLWAFPGNMLESFLNDECQKKYGDNLFILKTLPQCRYLFDGKELIGERFEVVEKFCLKDPKELANIIIKYDEKCKEIEDKISSFNEMQESYEAKISSLNDDNSYLANNNKRLILINRILSALSIALVIISIACFTDLI